MPGLVGYCADLSPQEGAALLHAMARSLEAEPRFRAELDAGAGFGLGRVSLGLANPQPQPLWNADRTIGLVMDGELVEAQGLAVLGRTASPAPSDAALLLRLYEEMGEDFALQLNGPWTAAIWDGRTRRLVIANDRLGLHPLYYSQVAGGLIFGGGVRGLLAHPSLPRCMDRAAMAQFLTFDHVLGQRTLVKDVHLLPGGSVLTFHDGRLDLRPYWRPLHPSQYMLRSEEELMAQLLHYLEQAVQRQVQRADGLALGLMLSGGVDSRVLLAYLVQHAGGRPLNSFTWGIPGCNDATYARQVARTLGVPNAFYELRPDWLLRQAEEAVRIIDGLGNVVNLHALATLEPEAQAAPVIFKGFLGDAMMGFAQRPQHWADYDDATRIQAHLQVHRDQGVISFDPAQHSQLFSAACQSEVGDAVLAEYRAGMDASRSSLLADQRIYFDYTQRVPRMTINGVEVVRSRAVVRLPFCDNDLIDFMLAVPPGYRYQRSLMRNAFIRAFPQLAQIPITDTGLPLATCARDVTLRAEDWARWHLHQAGLRRVAPTRRRPYKDYAAWMRGVLRPWVEETLLSPHTLGRGHFQPAFVRQVVAEHMAGANHAVRLGALLTLELWQRRFID
jgi:asparagine synthase (glutamine-hydrolysing)